MHMKQVPGLATWCVNMVSLSRVSTAGAPARWKSKFGGMEVSDAKRLRELEAENGRLKRLLAEAELDKSMLRDVLSKIPDEAGQAQW